MSHRRRTALGAGFLLLVALLQPTAAQAVSPRPSTPTARPAAAEAVPAYTTSRCGNSSGRIVLSFDDWAYGDPYRATRVGAYLKSRGVRALFFPVNQYARQYPDIISTLRTQGHWVGNHTYSHRDLTTLSDSGVSYQIRNGITSNLLRPPYGAYNSRVSSLASAQGHRICMWTIDTRDWQRIDGSYRSTSSIRYIVRASSSSSKSSGMILGHLQTNFPRAVGGIIDDLTAQGYRFCRNSGPVGRSVPYPMTC